MFDDLTGIDEGWAGLQCFVKVERTVLQKNGKQTEETAYFCSSLPGTTPARIFSSGIRGHWRLEATHYVKDVTFKEDSSKIKTESAPENMSLIRNIAINLFRGRGYDNLAQAIRLVAHDIPALWGMVSA